MIEALVDEPLVSTIYKNDEKVAGLQSHRFSKSVEPPLQHRRYVGNSNVNVVKSTDGEKDNSDVSSCAMPTKIKVFRNENLKYSMKYNSCEKL